MEDGTQSGLSQDNVSDERNKSQERGIFSAFVGKK
jgi:hypothetical protein